MWLLDANMDVHLVGTLTNLGISCDTAVNRGWKTLSNGSLAMAAVAGLIVEVHPNPDAAMPIAIRHWRQLSVRS